MNKFKMLIAAMLVTALSSCTDATFESYAAYGDQFKVTCWSGGKISYSGMSTGKVMSLEASDGWQFKEQGTNKFVRISGDCIIRTK